MIITKKTRLLAAHDTRIRIKLDDPSSLTWGIYNLTMSEGHEKAVIDWGDGMQSEIHEGGQLTHTYAQPGEYEVHISDDIASLGFSYLTTPSPFKDVYAAMIREFHTTAAHLDALEMFCFEKATNLCAFECEKSGLRKLNSRLFWNCTSLAGRIDLPGIVDVASATFSHATGISELHFSAANEATIKALPDWESTSGKFGAANATVYFDL